MYNLVPMAINGYVHYRIRTNRTVTWFWLLALSLMDLALISISTTITGGFSCHCSGSTNQIFRVIRPLWDLHRRSLPHFGIEAQRWRTVRFPE